MANDALIKLKVGDQVLLVDGRGCSLVHIVTDADRWSVDEGFQLAGQCWDSMRFHVVANDGQELVLRSDTPAIGRPDSPWHPTFRPHGWRSPSRLTLALRRRTL